MTYVRTKICGVTRAEDLSACAAAGVAYVGLNFFPKSPRYLDFDRARSLALQVPSGMAKVGLSVDADNDELDAITGAVPLDILQLHGRETPERVAEVRARYGLPVMKALGIASEDDLPAIVDYGKVADQLLIEGKAPKDAILPGGNGLTFDWRLIAGRRWPVPWMLAGGLTPDNVGDAITLTGTRQVDVSSGVESAPGVKDAALIAAFVAAARPAEAPPNLRRTESGLPG